MSLPSPVTSDRDRPTKVDVVVIGGGIAGIATALELGERGNSVAVFEKGIVAGEQSSRNWGWCRRMGRDPRELPLIEESMRLWQQMHQRTGEDVGFRECGIAYLCDSEEKLAARQRWYQNHAQPYGLSSRMVSAEEANALTPDSTVPWLGGLFTAEDGRAEPVLAVPAMARAAQKCGVKIFQHCAVRGLQQQAGRISGVVTEHGEISCDAVVLAGGAWSRRFCHNAGIGLPQLTVVNSVMRTAPLQTGYDHSLAARDFAFRKRMDGGYTVAHATLSMADILPDSFRLAPEFWPVLKEEWRDFRFRIGQRFVDEARLKRRWELDEESPFEQVRILDPKPIASIQQAAMHSLKNTLPAFTNAKIEETWAGVIDVTPDVVPVISPVAEREGFYLATGFSGHGFGLGPGAGKLMAQIVNGETPCVNPEPFRYERFFQ